MRLSIDEKVLNKVFQVLFKQEYGSIFQLINEIQEDVKKIEEDVKKIEEDVKKIEETKTPTTKDIPKK